MEKVKGEDYVSEQIDERCGFVPPEPSLHVHVHVHARVDNSWACKPCVYISQA